jgi:small subunit ribosomal protein S6
LLAEEKHLTQYETLIVVHPERGPRVKEFVERFQKVIEGQNGSVLHVDEWGLRDLAYRIENQAKGYYAIFYYQGTGQTVQELERNLRLTDGILRYMTIRSDGAEPAAPASRTSAVAEEAQKREPEA